mmetsp:Transcript_9901/g.14792  ORF Transcript_9901/g.14792 Transcript_9901/m.14792 type:complete len:225 (-) Transcript_9901:558-1232(-)
MQQVETLLVGHAAEGLVRILSIQRPHQPRKRVRGSHAIHVILQVLPVHLGRQLAVIRTLDCGGDLPLQPHGPALVQPKVVPRVVGHQVARPAVGDLVGDDVSQRAVAGQQRGGREGQAGVFHAAIGERWRETQHVIATPSVGHAGDLLRRGQELLSLTEFMVREVDHRRFGPNAHSRTHLPGLQLARSQSNQVGRGGHCLCPLEHRLTRWSRSCLGLRTGDCHC